MNSRERVISALKRMSPDRVPMYFEFTPHIERLFEEKTSCKAENYQSYFNFDMLTVEPEKLLARTNNFEEYYKDVDLTNVKVDEWGIGHKKGSVEHFERLIHPLNKAVTLDDILKYPYPVVLPEDDCYKKYKTTVEDLHNKGYAVMSRGQSVGGTIFWPAYKLRGMEQLMIDMYINEELFETLLDKVMEIIISLCCEKVKSGIDVILLADDFGTQRDLMMSPPMWERWFKKRLKKIISCIKNVNPDIIIAFHSDGAIQKIIPHLIEIGVDVLNPLQPECMDIFEIKRIYGEKLSFWGTIGTQTTMPFGTVDEVKEAVKKSIQEIGKDGGLLIAPTHLLEPEVPWENIMAFVEAVRDYGKY